MSVILLCGEEYYPRGWRDFRGKFATPELAKASIPQTRRYEDAFGQTDAEWYEIIDYDTLDLVEKGSWQRQWTACTRCRGDGRVTTYTNNLTHQGMRVTPVQIICPACKGDRGIHHGPEGWHKDGT